MVKHTVQIVIVSAALCLGSVPVARAQFAVVDVAAIVRLVQQITMLQQQLLTMQNHLRQAQQAYAAITGNRGMENLLQGTVRNYLPADWAALQAAVTQASSTYGALSAAIQSALTGNAVLTTAQLASLSTAERTQITTARQTVAMLQATAQQALATTSSRFDAIQELIVAIGTADDQKAIMDLQARIAAEQGMLANEQTKLQVIFQTAQAEQWAVQQKSREYALSDIGSLRALPAMGLWASRCASDPS